MEENKKLDIKLVPGIGQLPYPAYRGSEPYVFISYARLDSEKVYDQIRRFNESGFNVWYDEGIAPGNEWSDEIAEALTKCSVFVVMLTPTSAPREAVLNEISFALDEGKPFLAIHLEETELPPGLRLRISRKQAILKYKMTDEEYEFKYTEAFTRFGLKRRDAKPETAPEKKDVPVQAKNALGEKLDDYENFIGRAVLDEKEKEEAAKLEESLVKDFHTLGKEGKLEVLKAAYERLEKLANENPFPKLRLGWVRNRAKSDYAFVLSVKSDLESKKEALRLFEELASSSPNHTGYADNARIIKKQIADYFLRMAENGDRASAERAEKLYTELADKYPDRDYGQFIIKARALSV
ncbi:MAG: toll/interleukin-1 receptor domain-containing protein [Clostridia bacterium]|nr:toll/interleukin-1 receptor domain-containing protein [Clostridia bacterium]